MPSRPIRDFLERGTDSIPEGPLGVLGKGKAVGAVNYFAVGLANTFTPPGIDVGFDIESHSVERGEDKNIHSYVINAANKDVAKFAARLNSSPSNIDSIISDSTITKIEPLEKRRTFTAWEITVESEKRMEDGNN